MKRKTEIRVTTNDVMTVGEAAKALNVTRMTVYRWIKAGKIIALEIGGVTFVPVKAVNNLAEDVA